MEARIRPIRPLPVAERPSRFRNPSGLKAIFSRPEVGYAWFFLRLFVGWQWLNSGWHKLVGPTSAGWVRDGQIGERSLAQGDSIMNFWQRAVAIPEQGQPAITYGWYRNFLQMLIDNQANGWFAYVIAIGEFMVGIALILGAFTAIAALFGAFMNLNYMLAGDAGANPVLFFSALLLVLAWRNAGYVGLDRWLLPLLGTPWQRGQLWQREPHIIEEPIEIPSRERERVRRRAA
jgi:thiosulfate dehydrogenase (quinone) large subunit